MKQTTLCYIDDGSRYLMLHRVKKENDASHGKWIGVGGKCEADESPDECMLREVKEETGLTIDHWRYRGIVTFISDTWPNEYMHLFTADSWSGELDMDCNEGDLAWIPKSVLSVQCAVCSDASQNGDSQLDTKHLPLNTDSLPLWEGDRIFLRLLLDEQQPFFSLKLVYKQDEMTSATLNGQSV